MLFGMFSRMCAEHIPVGHHGAALLVIDTCAADQAHEALIDMKLKSRDQSDCFSVM